MLYRPVTGFNTNFVCRMGVLFRRVIFLIMNANSIRSVFPLLIFLTFFVSCERPRRAPDVSSVQIPFTIERFEKDFFSIDTLHLEASLEGLSKKYPGFLQDFLYNIIGTTPEQALNELPKFLSTYQIWHKAIQSDQVLEPYFMQVRTGCKYVKYYFPQYALPKKLITFIGPVNGFGNVLTPEALAVGLQVYMGKDFAWYASGEGQQLYPPFMSRRFEPEYIPVNCMKNIIDDLYPNKSAGRPLVEQMIESGKRVALLSFLLPNLSDTLITGYTAAQLDACKASEKGIWSYFVQNNLLFGSDPTYTRDYLTDSPGTPELGDQAPGNIGQFCGWQIVKKWMDQQKDMHPDKLMKTPAATIFQEAKYKP